MVHLDYRAATVSRVVATAGSIANLRVPVCPAEWGGGFCGDEFLLGNSTAPSSANTIPSCDEECRTGDYAPDCTHFTIESIDGSSNRTCSFFRSGCTQPLSNVPKDLKTTFALERNLNVCKSAFNIPRIKECRVAIDGGCVPASVNKTEEQMTIAKYFDRAYSLEECRFLCSVTDNCDSFFLTKATGACELKYAGCEVDLDLTGEMEGYYLDQCTIRGEVCPAKFVGNCASSGAQVIPEEDLFKQTGQVNPLDTRIQRPVRLTDLKNYCRGRGFATGDEEKRCQGFARSSETGELTYYQGKSNCVVEDPPSTKSFLFFDLDTMDQKCKRFVPRVGPASCPRTWSRGFCGNAADKQIATGAVYNDRIYSVQECRYLCSETEACGGFFLQHKKAACWLFQEGCEPSGNVTDFDYYAMSSCKPSTDGLSGGHGSKIDEKFLTVAQSGPEASVDPPPPTTGAVNVLLRPENDFSSYGWVTLANVGYCTKTGPATAQASHSYWRVDLDTKKYIAGFSIFANGDLTAECRTGVQNARISYYKENYETDVNSTTSSAVSSFLSRTQTPGLVSARGAWIAVNQHIDSVQLQQFGAGNAKKEMCFCGLWLYEAPPPVLGQYYVADPLQSCDEKCAELGLPCNSEETSETTLDTARVAEKFATLGLTCDKSTEEVGVEDSFFSPVVEEQTQGAATTSWKCLRYNKQMYDHGLKSQCSARPTLESQRRVCFCGGRKQRKFENSADPDLPLNFIETKNNAWNATQFDGSGAPGCSGIGGFKYLCGAGNVFNRPFDNRKGSKIFKYDYIPTTDRFCMHTGDSNSSLLLPFWRAELSAFSDQVQSQFPMGNNTNTNSSTSGNNAFAATSSNTSNSSGSGTSGSAATFLRKVADTFLGNTVTEDEDEEKGDSTAADDEDRSMLLERNEQTPVGIDIYEMFGRYVEGFEIFSADIEGDTAFGNLPNANVYFDDEPNVTFQLPAEIKPTGTWVPVQRRMRSIKIEAPGVTSLSFCGIHFYQGADPDVLL
ncbi:unnamed protein product [Amoebophrya sp. A120]|nr:unnamed protein product [Amoebophrya sp. A120]|eukprot:GSA120T00000871001.1